MNGSNESDTSTRTHLASSTWAPSPSRSDGHPAIKPLGSNAVDSNHNLRDSGREKSVRSTTCIPTIGQTAPSLASPLVPSAHSSAGDNNNLDWSAVLATIESRLWALEHPHGTYINPAYLDSAFDNLNAAPQLDGGIDQHGDMHSPPVNFFDFDAAAAVNDAPFPLAMDIYGTVAPPAVADQLVPIASAAAIPPVVSPAPTGPPYSCPDCPSTFRRSSDRARHQRKHNANEPRHPCPVCNSSFLRRDKLTDHRRSKAH